MKKLQLIPAVLLLCITVFSCSSNDDDNDDVSCENAITATAAAELAFDNASDANYSERCAAYKAALLVQINSCGDQSGSLQAIIDDLGDCILSTNSGVVTVTVGTLVKTFETNIEVTTVGTTKQVRAEDDATSDWIYFEVQQSATGTDIISNFNIHLISSDYIPLPDDEGGNFTSNITVNNTTAIDGTFSGYVQSPTTGADIPLTSGMINIDL